MTERKRIGKYEILEEIGRGGFAVVYKAYDPPLDREIALKVLAPHLTWDPPFAERFRREAQSTAKLSHPHIVTIHEVGQDDEQLYIAMEYLPGCTLAKLLEDEGAMSLERALPILERVADALDYAHDQGVIHRDVKPRNIMVEETGRGVRVTLMDFGLVKVMESSESLTSAGAILGSPEYMAPEQADPGRKDEIGPATDRYALGIVAYHMLTGRVPFPGNTPSTLNAHENKPVPRPRLLRPDLPKRVDAMLIRMLSKAPDKRYVTASTFVDRLREAVPKNGDPRPSLPAWAWAVIVLVLVVGAVYLGTRVGGRVTPEVTTTATVAPKLTDVPVVTREQTQMPTATHTLPSLVFPTKTPTSLPSATDTLPPTNTPIATATRTLTATATDTPTTTVPPIDTLTFTPTPTTAPTNTPTLTPTKSTPTQVPETIQPQLTAPEHGREYKNPITFQWTGSLNAGEMYQVNAYHSKSGYTIQSDLLTTPKWIIDLPGDQYGEWRWKVSVVQEGRIVATSPEWMFWFQPGGDGRTPTKATPPTNTPATPEGQGGKAGETQTIIADRGSYPARLIPRQPHPKPAEGHPIGAEAGADSY